MGVETRISTRNQILKGAVEAVARHGLAKLDMSDVSSSAGVSRATLYRYFSNRDELLQELSAREGIRFWQSCLAALRAAPEGEERIRLLLRHATQHVREHAALQRLLETDPAFVLRSVREQFPEIREQLHRLLAPTLEATPLARQRILSTEQLVDWITRLLISAFLIPSDDPEQMTEGLATAYRLLTETADEDHTP